MIGVSALMRTEVVAATGGFDPAFRGYEDWEFWLNALHHGWQGRRVEAETLLYRRHPGTSVNVAARQEYRATYRRLRIKHAHLYARRAELAREEGTSRLDRVVHPLFWGFRPIPARLEHVLHSRLFRQRSA
jgi:GT2 family glycosyltransferase